MNQLAAAIEEAIGVGSAPMELARAKINLALHVAGLRSDGYHELETLVVFADYGDFLTAAETGNGKMGLAVRGPFADALMAACPPGDNLVIKAANLLADQAGKRKPPAMRLALTKRLPVAAGVGGGSADAAAVLRLLDRTWGLGFGEDKLAGIGRSLGADVPMCVLSTPLVAEGIGDRIRPLSGVPAMPVVLANPGVHVSTRDVFARLDTEERTPLPTLPQRFASLLDLVFWLRKARNDLAAPAAKITRRATAAERALTADPECLFARMSGSGATAFGIFTTIDAAERGAARIRHAKPGWWVTAAMTGAS